VCAAGHETHAPFAGPALSTRTRYLFTLIVALFGVYQITNDHPVAGLIGIGLAGVLFFLVRKV
jgi:hypothetical protein